MTLQVIGEIGFKLSVFGGGTMGGVSNLFGDNGELIRGSNTPFVRFNRSVLNYSN